MNVTLELRTYVCSCGCVYAMHANVIARCPGCEHRAAQNLRNGIEERDEEIRSRDRIISALKGALTKAKRRAA